MYTKDGSPSGDSATSWQGWRPQRERACTGRGPPGGCALAASPAYVRQAFSRWSSVSGVPSRPGVVRDRGAVRRASVLR
jgi:hypothetical protein